MRGYVEWFDGLPRVLRRVRALDPNKCHGVRTHSLHGEQCHLKRQPLSAATSLPASSSGVHPVGPLTYRPLLRVLDAKSRSALEDATETFLSCERRRLYAIYRPSPGGSLSHVFSPHDYVCVLQKLGASGMGAIAKNVYLVLVELLRKPLHPSHAGMEWDLSDDAIVDIRATALAAVMSGLEGPDALGFAQNCLVSSSSLRFASGPSDSCEPLLQTLRELLRGGLSAGIAWSKTSNVDMESNLMLKAPVVAAVAASLIRCNTGLAKQQAIELLRLASIARLRGVNAFDESVAEKCAESAALIGDVETVTRIIFLLYRSSGMLAQPVSLQTGLCDNMGGGGCAPVSGDINTRGSGSLWVRAFEGLGFLGSTRRCDAGDANIAFSRSTVRMLKNVIYAVLHRSENTGSQTSLAAIKEAVRLFDYLRFGCDWDSMASMVVEILTCMRREARRYYGHEPHEGGLESLFYLHREALRIVAVLRDSLSSRCLPYQHLTYATCVGLAIEGYLVEAHNDAGSGMVISLVGMPLMASKMQQQEYLASAATAALGLFDTLATEYQVQHLDLLLIVTTAALTAGAAFPTDGCSPNCVFPRLKEVFLRAGLLAVNPTDVMNAIASLGHKSVMCGALFFYTILSVGLFSDAFVEGSEGHNAMVMGARTDEWVMAALPVHRKLLWGLLCCPVFQSYALLVPLLSSVVLSAMKLVANVLFKYPEQHEESVTMLRYLYSQKWQENVMDVEVTALVDRLLSRVLCFTITSTTLVDIAQFCSNSLSKDHASEEVLVILGASSMENLRGVKQNFSEQLQGMTLGFQSAGDFSAADLPRAVTRRLILTLSAVLLLVDLPLEVAGSKPLSGGASEVLRWLQYGPPSDVPFHQVLVMAPIGHQPSLQQADFAGERLDFPPNVQFRDGVMQSCAISRIVIDHLFHPAWISRFAVFFWDDDRDEQQAETSARHTFLLRHGVRSLSHRRAQVKRARADVMNILQASVCPEMSVPRHHRDSASTFVKLVSERNVARSFCYPHDR